MYNIEQDTCVAPESREYQRQGREPKMEMASIGFSVFRFFAEKSVGFGRFLIETE